MAHPGRQREMNPPNSISFEVLGDPKGQPRPKAFARKFANGAVMARVYDPGTAEGWKGQIALAAKEHCPFPPLSGPLRVDIEFRMPRPKSHYKAQSTAARLAGAPLLLKKPAPHWHTSKPDCDNASKAVLDALTTLGFWVDDSQVCIHNVIKIYTHEHDLYGSTKPGATITIRALAIPTTAKPEPQLAL